MGVAYNPGVVADRIILAYDEGNPKSGTSSELISTRTASAISGTQRDFSQDSTLATTYAITNQYNSSAPSPGTGFSFSSWIRRTGSTSGNWDVIVYIEGSSPPAHRMLWFGWFFNTTDRIHCSMPYYSATDTPVYWSVDPFWSDAGLTLVTNQWYNFTATYANSTRVLTTYINGRFALSGIRPGLGDLNNPNGAPIRMFGCNNTPNGNSQLSSFTIYNKALSQSEVQQNFNALRGRYGI